MIPIVRRLPRILLKAATLLATLLILFFLALWIRSYLVGGDRANLRLGQKSVAGLLSTEGRVRFVYA
jgi:hypothetical protein